MKRSHGPLSICPGDQKYISVFGLAKPINAGSAGIAAYIVCACNNHNDLLAALHNAEMTLNAIAESMPGSFGVGSTLCVIRAAIAKAEL